MYSPTSSVSRHVHWIAIFDKLPRDFKQLVEDTSDVFQHTSALASPLSLSIVTLHGANTACVYYTALLTPLMRRQTAPALKARAQITSKKRNPHAHDSDAVCVLQVSLFHELMNSGQDGQEREN